MSDTDSEVQFNFTRHQGNAAGLPAVGSPVGTPVGSSGSSSSDSSVVAHGQRRRLRVVESDSDSSLAYTDARENASPAGVRRSSVGGSVGAMRRRLPDISRVPAVSAANAVSAAGAGSGDRVR